MKDFFWGFNLRVQPWWLGSLARYLLHSVEEAHLVIGGSNPAWGMVPHSEPATHRRVLYQPKSLRAGLGWCVASIPLPSGPNTGSNPGEGRVIKKNTIGILNLIFEFK